MAGTLGGVSKILRTALFVGGYLGGMPDPLRACPCCGNAESRSVPAFAKHFLHACLSCGMVYCKRTPTQQDLDALYNNYPTRSALSSVTRARYNELLQGMERYRTHGRLLDVGCGDGYFLDVAKERGWTVFGTEYNERTVAKCRERGILMQQGPLDPKNYPADHFDVITSFEVIEHVQDPDADIRNMAQLLRKGGYVYMTTPNFRSLAKWMAGPNWSVVNWPEHLNYFTPHTLGLCMANNGLRKQRVLTTGVTVSRVRAGRRNVEHSVATPANNDEQLRLRIESKWYLQMAKRMLNGGLDLFKIGDSLKAGFVKPA